MRDYTMPITFIEQGEFTYQVSDNHAILTGAIGPISNDVYTYQGYLVTEFAANAFRYIPTYLTETLTLTNITYSAFEGFTALTDEFC